MLMVISKDVTDILTKKTLYALSEFLRSLDIDLVHTPSSICMVWLAWLERLDLLFDPVIPRDIGH